MKTYLRHKILNVVDVKELFALEYLDFEGKYKDYVEKHDFWELCYVKQGQVSVVCGSETRTVCEGEVMLLEPNMSHTYYSENGNTNKTFVVCFECSSQALKALGGKIFSVEKEQVYCMEKIIEESEHTFFMNNKDLLEAFSTSNFGGQQAILMHLEYLLIRLVRRSSVGDNLGVVFLREEEFYEDLANIIIRFFKEHVCEKISLDDICKKVNYSRSFLCRMFKGQTGETLFSYFNRLKIEKAKKMLQETSCAVVNISRTLGFSEDKYFSALFKKLVGVTPVEYRTQYCKTNKEKIHGKISR